MLLGVAEFSPVVHWSQVKVVRQLSKGFEKMAERKIQVCLVVAQGRVQR
jgi:hypothetical protein